MNNCKYCKQEIELRQSKRTGKWYPVNEDDSFHSNTCNGVRIEYSQAQKLESLDQPNFNKSNHLLEKARVDDAKKYIGGLNKRLTKYELELVVKVKGVA